MSIKTEKTEPTPIETTEVIEIDGGKIIETIEKMVDKQNISRLIIYKPNGDIFLNLSFVAGLTMALLTTFLLPQLLGLGIIGVLLGGFKIEVVRRERESLATPSSQVEVEVEVAVASKVDDAENE